MYINKVDNTNFQAIYRIKNLPNVVSEIETKIIPTYEAISNEAAMKLMGDNPYRKHVFTVLDRIAKSNNSSISWAKMNAKNHGIDTSVINEDKVYIFTGDRELVKLAIYMSGRNKELKPTFIDKIKSFFSINDKNDVEFPEDMPLYLRPLVHSIYLDKKETLAFDEYIKGKVIDVSSPQDLFFKMMHER